MRFLVTIILCVTSLSLYAQWVSSPPASISNVYYSTSNVAIGATTVNLSPATLDVVGSRGTIDNRNFRVVYANAGSLLGTEFSALTHLQSDLSLSWTAMYAKQGAAAYAAVINGKSFFNGNIGVGTSSPVSQFHIKNSSGTALATIESSGLLRDSPNWTLEITAQLREPYGSTRSQT